MCENDDSTDRLPSCHTWWSYECEVPVLAMSTAVEEPTAELLWTSALQRLHALSHQVACNFNWWCNIVPALLSYSICGCIKQHSVKHGFRHFYWNKITFKQTWSLFNAVCFKNDNNLCTCAVSALNLIPVVNMTLEINSATSISYMMWKLSPFDAAFSLFWRFFTVHAQFWPRCYFWFKI